MFSEELAVEGGHFGGEQRRHSSLHRENRRIDGGQRSEGMSLDPLTQLKGPPWRPGGRQECRWWHSGPLSRHLPLDDQVCSGESTIGFAQEMAHHCGRGPEGKGAEGSKRSIGEAIAERVEAHDRHIGDLATL